MKSFEREHVDALVELKVISMKIDELLYRISNSDDIQKRDSWLTRADGLIKPFLIAQSRVILMEAN